MNPLLRWLTSPEWAHVVAALLHSLWQGAIVALALALLMRRLTNPLTRYRCALSALGVIGIAGIVTWALLNAPTSAPQPTTATAIEPTTPAIMADAFDSNPTDKVVVIGQMKRPEAPTHWTAWLALTWMAGALVMLLRAGVKVAGAEKLRRSCQPLADENIATLVAEACRAVGLARKIRVAVTDKLTSPAVVGVLVPTLILPLSLFTTLTPTQIQFVLLHELAHIRRGDYLANLFQLFAEALLFFNPAVWWISHQIRREREACCDALAIELSGAPADYARTLVRVAENILQPAPAAAPAFGDDGREPSSLADRVQRLVVPGYRPALRLTWRAMATSLLVGVTLLVLSAVGTRNTVGAILSSTQSATNLTQTALNQSLSRTNQAAHNGTNTIAPGELIVVTFSGITEPPPSHEERVKPDGSILLPNIGRVVAAGKSSSQLQQEIHDAYVPTFYKRLAISVKVETNAASMFQPRRLTTPVAVGDFTEFGGNELTTDKIEFNQQTQEMIAKREVRFRSQATQDWFGNWTANAVTASSATATNNSREPLFTRAFNLPPEVLYGKIITNLAPAAMSGPATGVKGEDVQTASAGFRAWCHRLGVDLDPQLGKSVFYSNRGGLLVRATMTELNIIEEALQKLAEVPPQVHLKVLWTEIPQSFIQELPFSTPSNALALPIFRASSRILSKEEMAQTLSRLRKRDKISLLSEGQVTTLSDRQAQIQAVEKQTIITGFNPKALVKPGVTAPNDQESRKALFEMESKPLGPVIDLLPILSSDGDEISLRTIAATTEFIGYESTAPEVPVYLNGNQLKLTLPLPKYRVHTMTNLSVLRDGQTLVLGQLPITELTKNPSGEFEQKDITVTQTNNLYVFITATLIDPAGNPINKDLGIPSKLPLR